MKSFVSGVVSMGILSILLRLVKVSIAVVVLCVWGLVLCILLAT